MAGNEAPGVGVLEGLVPEGLDGVGFMCVKFVAHRLRVLQANNKFSPAQNYKRT